MSETASPTLLLLAQKILDAIPLTPAGATKAHDFGDASINPAGTVVCQVSDVTQPNLGLPDYFLTMSVQGLTFASVDPGQTVISQLYADCVNAISTMTPADLPGALPEGAVLAAVMPISTGRIEEDEDQFGFSITFQIVAIDLHF